MSLSVVLVCALLLFTVPLTLFSEASADAARVDSGRIGTSIAGGPAFGTIDADQEHVYDGGSELVAPIAGVTRHQP